MNPITNAKNLNKLNERELSLNIAGSESKSWHQKYKDSAWVFVGGLPYDLTEGDVVCVFSQYGEIVNINLIRDRKTGKSKGFCFLCYEDQRSTILAVDNLNGTKILNRIIRVDHVENYKVPKVHDDEDEVTRKLYEEGCAPKLVEPEISDYVQDHSATVSHTPSDVKHEKKHKRKHDTSSHKKKKADSSRKRSRRSVSSESDRDSHSSDRSSSSGSKKRRRHKQSGKRSPILPSATMEKRRTDNRAADDGRLGFVERKWADKRPPSDLPNTGDRPGYAARKLDAAGTRQPAPKSFSGKPRRDDDVYIPQRYK